MHWQEMFRLIDMLRRSCFTDDPVVALWHYACGRMADWEEGRAGAVTWSARSHRGVQWLHKVEFPRKQKRYIFSPLFDIRYNTAFEEVIRACAESGVRKDGRTWIVEGFIRAMINLNQLGFAHSYEAWHEGKLVGGAFGVQLGSMVTCDSMFYRMSNASKAAYGQTLVRLQQRGFRVVDTNGVAQHMVNYGEVWMPQPQFQKLIGECLNDAPSLTDDRPYPKIPWEIRAYLPVLRGLRFARSKLRPGGGRSPAANPGEMAPTHPTTEQKDEPEDPQSEASPLGSTPATHA